MDKYMIVFRWLAQVGGASSCMIVLLDCNPLLAAALKPPGQLPQNIQLSGHPQVPVSR